MGGDRTSRRLSPISNDAGMGEATNLPISPLEGEMSGRTEGGAKDRGVLQFAAAPPTLNA
ncbi:hypothetical protein EOA22_11115 [Mesorhizobium sp. M7A.F.Ca.US.014.04.1.1]|nr:hypothetical protein EOC84_20580 [Mesorhizobium sp. Primo-B]RUU38775.1 hypothetical protein EOC83_13735 [Mesorhizobium sp. Primo-A]RUX14389.1 hypothetical protein EN996_16760 [Mesorhizobium sp. M7A.F.Ca.CA.002.14.1.2]RUX35244.1 hypothetical protein EN987_29925 [Mesorhizobium sp. M7A.F.Ca.CA.002.11.2.1]RUX44777.1 hypothetical protein EN994_27050 [Mesorhizobium sp. M7A.F.Ca.CA.002.09.1.1]RUX61157.1 hypothetical protein EN989_08295 [Mesorhizobium sp. M7A.F.Ca.CA.002.12.1.1]RUX65964.1 hypothet